MLQYPGVIPADGMVLPARLNHEAFNTCVLMLLQMCLKLVCSLTNVHLFAGAWHFVDDVCLLLLGEGVFDLCEERTEGGFRLEHCSDVEVPTGMRINQN